MIEKIFILLILYQLKHFVADFPLQGKYMLKKFLPDWGFFFPLLAHVSVHGVMTLGICLWFAPQLWWLSLVDMSVHFVMDRIKASPKYLGRFKALSGSEMSNILSYEETIGLEKFKPQLKSNVFFWWSLGFDQAFHHCTHYFIIYMLVAQ